MMYRLSKLLQLCAVTLLGILCVSAEAKPVSAIPQATLEKEPLHISGLAPEAIQSISQIAAGESHTCALTNDGSVLCWGSNSFGQLGSNLPDSSFQPVSVGGLSSDVSAITAGESHTCALTSGGVKCWGANGSGQLGDNSRDNHTTPVDVFSLNTGVTALAAGSEHTCAVVNKSAKCWGNNTAGQLGDGTLSDRLTPVEIVNLTDVITLAAGKRHTCGLTESGGVKCWGDNQYGQLGNGTTISSSIPVDVVGLASNIIAISAGDHHTCALTASGGIRCWGYNGDGRLGDGTTTNQTSPIDVSGLTSGVVSIAAGGVHACALLNNDVVKCWGRNAFGQLGNNSILSRSKPVTVVGLKSGVTVLAGGGDHTCAIVSRGVMCWGSNVAGQLGDGLPNFHKVPRDVKDLNSGVRMVTGAIAIFEYGAAHTCALTDSGGVKCWGRNTFGQLGNDTGTDSATPVDVANLSSGATDVVTGYGHSCALISGGKVMCWGYNGFGQLGDGTKTNRRTPVEVVALSDVRSLSAGFNFTCAVTNSGAVKCWGNNGQGQLGDGTTTERTIPADVSSLSNGVDTVSAGGRHVCALTNTGGVKCWGNNSRGQLGNNSTAITSSVPVDVYGLSSGVDKLGLGSYHSCAVINDGGVKCWGYNTYGQLGNDTTNDSTIPVSVKDLSASMIAIAAGATHTCGLTNSGGVKCWGANEYGQLGDDTAIKHATPVNVKDLSSGALAVGAGMYHSCAVAGTGGVKCWGYNGFGQLGNGSSGRRTIPVNVIDLLPGDMVTVKDESGDPVAGAIVELYAAGSRQASDTSDGNGRVFMPVPPNSALFARVEISGAQRAGWPYSVNLTNMNITGETVQPISTQIDNKTWVLTVTQSSPLVLFDLLVSVESCEGSAPENLLLAELKRGLISASNYLYDVTEGQFAFGNISIYDCGEHWTDADLQILASNHVRPHAIPGGITRSENFLYHNTQFSRGYFRMGRKWNRAGAVDDNQPNDGDSAKLDASDAFRTVIHEFLHYAGFTFDEYFYVDQASGALKPAFCPTPIDKQDSVQPEDLQRASVMYWPYTTSELDMRGAAAWSSACEQTEQFQVHGESAMETLLNIYADTQSPARWTFSHPQTAQQPKPGPAMPLELSQINFLGHAALPDNNRVVKVKLKNTQGGLIYTDQAQVFLLKQRNGKTQIMDQGTPNAVGEIQLTGVEIGDTVLATSWDSKLFGSLVYSSSLPGTLWLQLLPTSWQPIIKAQPIVDSTSKFVGVTVQAQLTSTANALQAVLVPVGGDVLLTQPLLKIGQDIYSGTFSFAPENSFPEAYLWVCQTPDQQVNCLPNQTQQMITSYATGGAPGSHGRSYPPKDPASSDGYCSFHLPADVLSSVAPAIVLPTRGAPPLLPGRKLVSTPCYLGVPSGVVFNQPVPLILYYNHRAIDGLNTDSLRIEYFDESTNGWKSVGGSVDTLNYFISTVVSQPGLYVVTAEMPNSFVLRQRDSTGKEIINGFTSPGSLPIHQALAGCDFVSLYTINWMNALSQFQRYIANAPSYVNTIQSFAPNRNYYIRVNADCTVHLSPQEQQAVTTADTASVALPNLQAQQTITLPLEAAPGTFYGLIQHAGQNISPGTSIRAQINGQTFAQTTSIMDNGTSVYVLDIPPDDWETASIEGGQPNQVVTFWVDDELVSQTAIWQPGKATKVDLISQNPPLMINIYLPLVSH